MVVPTLNRVADLRRCLAALARQTRAADQVVVVVHDSDTATRQTLTNWREAGQWVLATVRSRGLPAALNAGLEAADGDVICFTDDDAEPWPDWLERIEVHYHDPSVGAVGGRDVLVNEPVAHHGRCAVVGKVFWYGRYVGNHHLQLQSSRPANVDTLKGVNMSYRATALGGFRFDERLCVVGGSCTELDAGFFLRRGGWRLVYDPEIGVNHHHSERTWGVPRSDPEICYDFAHNYTYVVLKYVSWPRKLVALVKRHSSGTQDLQGGPATAGGGLFRGSPRASP